MVKSNFVTCLCSDLDARSCCEECHGFYPYTYELASAKKLSENCVVMFCCSTSLLKLSSDSLYEVVTEFIKSPLPELKIQKNEPKFQTNEEALKYFESLMSSICLSLNTDRNTFILEIDSKSQCLTPLENTVFKCNLHINTLKSLIDKEMK